MCLQLAPAESSVKIRIKKKPQQACRLSARKFQKFIVEFEVNQKSTLDRCREAFRWVAVGCSALQYVAVCCSMLQFCSVLRCATLCYSVLHCAAVCCSVRPFIVVEKLLDALQWVATCVAVCCSACAVCYIPIYFKGFPFISVT